MRTVFEEKKSKSRELEIAKRFHQIVDLLPVIAINNMLANLADAVELEMLSGQPRQGMPNRRWSAPSSPIIQFQSPPKVATEVVPMGVARDRFDLVVPIPPVEVLGFVATSLIFEF